MFGHLMPASGGQSVPLQKQRLFMGRAKGADAKVPLTRESAFFLLEMVEGFWLIDDLNCPGGLKVNGRPCKRDKLMPGDEFSIGKNHFRISYESPKYTLGKGRIVLAKPKAKYQSESGIYDTAGPLARLVPVGGGKDYSITKGKITIGRQLPCDLVIREKSISGKHCKLELIDGYWRLFDLESRNGIRVDGIRCDEAWVLPQHRLTLADKRFQLEYEGEGPLPTADAIPEESNRSLMDRVGMTDRDVDEVARAAEAQAEMNSRRIRLSDDD